MDKKGKSTDHLGHFAYIGDFSLNICTDEVKLFQILECKFG